ncbi:hypothetical protein MTO96_022158 [Rhipicephalus appendiculatus]
MSISRRRGVEPAIASERVQKKRAYDIPRVPVPPRIGLWRPVSGIRYFAFLFSPPFPSSVFIQQDAATAAELFELRGFLLHAFEILLNLSCVVAADA